MRSRKIHDFVQPPDPSGQASYLMSQRGDPPLIGRHKKQSPRVGYPPPTTIHHVMLRRGYRDRITLPPVWEKKP
jgi:hypothetical protein